MRWRSSVKLARPCVWRMSALGLGVDAFGAAVVEGQGESRADGVAVLVQAVGVVDDAAVRSMRLDLAGGDQGLLELWADPNPGGDLRAEDLVPGDAVCGEPSNCDCSSWVRVEQRA